MNLVQMVRPLVLGCVLISAVSGILLMSDRNQRSGGAAMKRVALVQHASQAALDEGSSGIMDSLAAHGFIPGKNLVLDRFNAQGDIGTANAIARQITNGSYDLIVSVSTVSLQTVANANRDGKTKHVFGVVADPFSAGVGVTREHPEIHPKHMTGIGSMVSVEKAFAQAKELNPGLKKIGLVWNSAESNAAAFARAGRAAAQKLGLELLEANAENSASVGESANSLVSRGVDALWISGDVTVLVAADAVISAAKQGHIPAFSIIPPNVTKGTLFDLGANFYEIGEQVGDLAVKVLQGTDPASVPVTNVVVEKLAVNSLALTGLRDAWRLPPDLVQRAALVVDQTGVHDKTVKKLARVYKLGLAYFAPEEGNDTCLRGLFDGLKELGFEEGKNLEVRRSHAQGEIVNIPAMLQNYDNQDVDAMVVLTTPLVTAASASVKKKNVVFTYVYDPIAAGAGKSREDHLPFITGVGSFPPVSDTIDVIKQTVPGVTAVGTLYNSSEANSRKVVSVARELFQKAGIKLEEVTITSTGEILQAAQVVTHRGVQALWVTGDNTALQGFDAIAKAAHDAKLPLIINDPEFTHRGAIASVGLGWYEAGSAASKLVARVLNGESPAKIPIQEVAVKKVVVNESVARELGLTLPPSLMKDAKRVSAALK